MSDKIKFIFGNGKQIKEKEFKRSKPMGFLFFMGKLPEDYKLVDVEGEGEIADFFREQIRLAKEQGDNYSPDYNKLIAMFLGGAKK